MQGPTKYRTIHKFSIFCSRLTTQAPQFLNPNPDGAAGAVFRSTVIMYTRTLWIFFKLANRNLLYLC